MKSNLLKWKMGAAAVLITLLGTPMFSQCPDGMVSYWGLDESVSTVYVDRVGGHNATAVSAPSNITGIVGNAKYFDGTKQVSVSSHSDYDFENNEGFSIAFWAKFSDVSFGTYNKILIGKNEPYATTGAKWWIASQLNSGLMSFTLVDSYGTQYNVSGTAINDDNWHYIVAVRDPDSNTIKLYIDGVAAGSTPTAYSGDFSSTAPIQIGFLNRQSIPDYWYKGALDEIAIFSRALETVEIMEQWTKGTLGIGYCDGYSPVIKSEPLLTAAVGQVYTYDVQASGMPPITFSLDEAPAGMTINPSTGVITWTPGSINVNGFVRVIASNPSYPPAAQQEFTINIASAPSCPPGLISLWRLNETAGPVYDDLYGVRDAVADIAPTPAAGIVGGAQTFTGTTTVNIVDDGSWEWPANVSFSIETWVKSTNVANSDVLVFIGRLRTDEWFTNWWVGMDANEYPVFYLRDSWGNDAILTGSTSLANGVWHQVVAVRDGVQNKNKLYIDGVKISEISVTYPHSFSVDANDSIPVNLGWFNSGSGHRFTGQMDEVALFNRALTDANVTSFYNSRNPVGHCAPGNYAPIITSEPETETLEKDLYEYTFVTSDFDAGDLLFLSAPVLPSWLEFTHTLGQRTALISGTPENEDVGDTTVTLRVSDGDITKNQTFTLTVINVNDNPVVNSTPSTSVDEGGSYSYTLIVSDADGDDLDITVPVLPDWLVWDEGSLTLSGLPENDDVGNHNVTISITDGIATVPHSFVITVNNVNMVPVITGQIPLSVSNSSTLTLAVNYFTVEDNDNDFPEHFTLTVFPGANYTLSGATITPSAGFLGTLYVGVKVSDLESTSDLYNATVTVVSGNVTPVIVGQAPLSVHNNSTLNLTLTNFTVIDPDNSYPADFTLNVSPGSHYSVSGTTITPEAAYLGNINVGVQVNDGVAASAVYYALVEVLGPVAVGDIETGALVMVYPNPATEVVHFKFDEQVNIGMLEIYSIIGNLVMKVPVESDLVAIDVTDLNKGAFVYRVVAGEKVIVGTFTISEN